MFEKFSRSWELVKASAAVLRSDKELMLFPVISTIATLMVLVTFAVPTFAWRVFDNGFGASAMVWAFLFYFCQYTVIIFFNCALVGAAMIRLDGGDPTLKDGLDVAKSRIVPILGYAAIAATVGMLLQSLKNKDNNFIVRLIGGGLGALWTLATFMVVPVLVSQDIGPIDALKQSANLLKRTWGENVIGTAGIGLVFGVLMVVGVVLGVVLTVLAAQLSVGMAIGVAVLFVIGLLLMGVYQAALAGIYSAALYRFATDGAAPQGFESLQLDRAFAAR